MPNVRVDSCNLSGMRLCNFVVERGKLVSKNVFEKNIEQNSIRFSDVLRDELGVFEGLTLRINY